jgi:hypothetical protein
MYEYQLYDPNVYFEMQRARAIIVKNYDEQQSGRDFPY